MRHSRNRPLTLLALFALALGACNLPGRSTPTPSAADAIYTAAAQTVAAQLTQVARPPGTTVEPVFPTATSPVGTFPPVSFPTATLPFPTATLPPTFTSIPPSPTPVPCDRVKFVRDVTYPDDSAVPAGTTFVKTWRLENAGSCTWTTGYALVFAGGNAMGGPASVALTQNVAPGQTIDVSVTLVAPSTAGTHRGDWKLRNVTNVTFGLGADNKPFYVQIRVAVATGLLYDFLVQASSGYWVSGVGTTPDTVVTFGGGDDDLIGVAKIKDSVLMENGSTSGRVLLTHPKHETDGFVAGFFPPYTVQSGDHFMARLGFMLPTGICGSDRVIFQLGYLEGTAWRVIREWNKSCNGTLLPVDVDLSAYRGQTLQFTLVVKADGPFLDDWAVWSSPRIEHP